MRAVITTYEGKHNHDVPAARGSGYTLTRPSPNPTSAAPIPIRPSVSSYTNSIQNNLLPTSSQAQMLQGSSGSFAFSGFGGRGNGTAYMNQISDNAFSRAKEEPRDDFFESFLNSNS